MTLLIYRDGLIGDFLGVIPIMIELARQDTLQVCIHPEAELIFQLIPQKYNIKLQEMGSGFDRVLELDINKAFELSHRHNYHMTQSYYACLGLPVPEKPPVAELEYELMETPGYDYILAPFSRSLPPQERWPREQWQRLTDLMPDKSFCIIGHERDERDFVTGSNISQMYNEPLVRVINTLRNSGKGLISVVSGPSHLAFHLGVKNYLLTNQTMTWGNNPEAIQISDHIPDLKAERVTGILHGNS
ncbi:MULTISPECIES: glycosyltransferase family 9 protein [Niastella]|uniref:Uncharacterized protein n=1 Tax=Niastella soli TaxID=2821487 RepID=A0ABS3Z5S0_9BACT|nr:hypothetical protein [Niastella soli]MBO9205509.1 hypothetical protein [Niastella soli]